MTIKANVTDTMKTNISGTISKDARPHSGLDQIGGKLHSNQMQRFVVVGVVEFHGYHEVRGSAPSVTAAFAAIEPILDGKDEAAVRKVLDKARAARGLAGVELTLFDGGGGADGPWPGDEDYKGPATTSGEAGDS